LAVEIEVREFTISTGTGNIDFTGFGFQPKACLFFFTPNASQNTDSESADGLGWGVGMCDGTREWAVYSGAEDAQTSSDVGRRSTTSGCILRCDEQLSQAYLGKATFVSFLATGVRVNRSTAFTSPTSPLVKIIAFGGSHTFVYGDIADHDATINVETTVTGVGFEPDLIFGASIKNHVDSDSDTVNDDHSFSFGWAVNPDRQASNNQYAIGVSGRDGQANGEASMSFHNNRCVVSRQDDAIDPGAEITSFDSDGFKHTVRDEGGATNDRFFYLALKLGADTGNIYTVNLDAPTATGNQIDSSAGFTPIILIGVLMGSATAVNSWIGETDARSSSINIGISDGTRKFSLGSWNDDEAATTNCASRIMDTKFWSLDTPAGVLKTEATITSLNSDGWTLNFSAVDTVVGRAAYLAIGDITPSLVEVKNSTVGVTEARNTLGNIVKTIGGKYRVGTGTSGGAA